MILDDSGFGLSSDNGEDDNAWLTTIPSYDSLRNGSGFGDGDSSSDGNGPCEDERRYSTQDGTQTQVQL